MVKAIAYPVTFALGAVIYSLVEILWRGHTHWTMSITGGLCLSAIYFLGGVMEVTPLPLRWLAGALTITLMELAVGCIVNLCLGWSVWDYSAVKYNLLGQICLPYCLLWYLLSIPAFYLCDLIRRIVSAASIFGGIL